GAPPSLVLEGQAAPLPASAAPRFVHAVSPGYFKTLGIAIVRGREFTEQDLEAAPPVAVINEYAARHWWPGQDPIGRTFRVDTAPSLPLEVTVVGVAHDNLAASPNLLLSDDGPEIYRPYEQMPSAFPTFFVASRTGPAPLLKPTRELLARLVPDRPVFGSLLAEDVSTQLGGVRLNAIQILAFALVGFGLALLGIHGVLSYTVRQRTQEIGIRGALGASRGGIERMVLMDAARLTGFGLLVGLPAAAFATRLIKGMLYGTSPTDPSVFVLVGAVVALVSLAAAYAPARRAAKVDPVIALRAS
ncbi:MAG TPA: FtsX-like permease family protein, partial [Gemmatimonadales bacterium]|nr:FtsX-like permease family protein [Gemmatimonadales bacterium]